MYKRLTAAFAVMLCLAILTVACMTASATEDSDIQTGESSEISSVVETSSDGETDSDTSSSTESESSEDNKTSSETTSSKNNRPIHSGGEYDNNHFIDQDFTSSNSSVTDTSSSDASSLNTESTVSVPYVEDNYSDEESYKGKVASLADGVYKYIWIPAIIALLCVAGLIIVNIMFRKKYPKRKSTGVSHDGSSHNAPRRRR